MSPYRYEWRGACSNAALNSLHAEAFDHTVDDYDWNAQLLHSLGWVCAYRSADLVGFVNVVWDGGLHAFLLDTMVAKTVRRQSVGTRLVEMAATAAREAGCIWLHVDFDDDLEEFYFSACGFTPTTAGLLSLRR